VSAPSSPGVEALGARAEQADQAARERVTTPVELFWDLVFVFAITQVTTLLGSRLTWAGFGRSMLVLALVWWAWSAFVWASNAQDPQAGTFRAVLLLASGLIFISGLALPRAFGAEATLFAATYAGVRLLHLALYVDASRRGNASLAAIAGFAATVAVGMALLVGGSFAHGAARPLLWAAAAAIDYAGPAWLTRERLRGLQQVAVAHFTERYSLFIIICLGESIVAVGLGASHRPLGAQLLVSVALALTITIGLWWTYFDRFAAAAERRLREHPDPVLAAADSYSYLHLLLVAGIIVFAVGAKFAIAHVAAPLSDAARLALCGGVALYLAGHFAFRLRITGELRYAKLLAALACMAVFALAGGLDAWAVASLLVAVLALLLLGERREPVEQARAAGR
jgi:low temperature requirement protein LtrA